MFILNGIELLKLILIKRIRKQWHMQHDSVNVRTSEL